MKGNCAECCRRWVCEIDPSDCIEWPDPVPVTNADLIRSMSDEELADVVAKGVGCVLKAPHCMDVDCTPCILKWLKQPAEEADHVHES